MSVEELQSSQERGFQDFSEGLIQHIDEVFFWSNPGNPTPYYVSQAYERIWGRPCSSVYANPSSWLKSIHPEDEERVVQELQRAAIAGHVQVEYRIIRPDCTMRWIWLRTFPILTDGVITRLVGIAQDCSDRKLAEGTRAFLASIVESSDDSIIGTSMEGNIVSWNQSAQKFFGYTPAEAIGQHITMLFPPGRKAEYLESLGKARVQERIERFESTRVAKGGRMIEVAVILSQVRDANGNLQGISAIYRDISELKKAQRERELMEVQLRHAQKMESIGQLAAGIAHEINTPTQYIGDNTRFLKDAFRDLEQVLRGQQAILALAEATGGAHQEDDQGSFSHIDIEYLLGEIPKAVDQTLDGVERVATLVSAMKEFSHPGRKEKTPVDLNSAIASTITVARNEWKYAAELEADYDSTLPLVVCLPGDFNQVILNLVVNAAHAITDAKAGGLGKITVQTRNCRPWAEIRVQDSGGGIPEHVRDRIFEPFFTTKEVGKGTGQGLAIAHSVVVDKHNGSIRFETEVGKGTTFIVRLPIDGKGFPPAELAELGPGHSEETV